MERRKSGGGLGVIIVLVVLFFVFKGSIGNVINDVKNEFKESSIYQDGLDSGNVKSTLDKANKELKSKYNGAKIQLIVVKSLVGYDIKEYAGEHFKSEGLANIEEGNGLLLVVSIEDRQYATYYGAALSDEMAGEIAVALRNTLKPALEVTDTTNLVDFNKSMESSINKMATILGNYCAKLNSNKD